MSQNDPSTVVDHDASLDERGLELRDRCAALFGRFGIKALSMDDLAGQLACSKKTLYKHFSDKRDLVSKALHGHLDGLEALAELWTCKRGRLAGSVTHGSIADAFHTNTH